MPRTRRPLLSLPYSVAVARNLAFGAASTGVLVAMVTLSLGAGVNTARIPLLAVAAAALSGFGVGVAQGRNWARISLGVFAIVAIPVGVQGVVGPGAALLASWDTAPLVAVAGLSMTTALLVVRLVLLVLLARAVFSQPVTEWCSDRPETVSAGPVPALSWLGDVQDSPRD